MRHSLAPPPLCSLMQFRSSLTSVRGAARGDEMSNRQSNLSALAYKFTSVRLCVGICVFVWRVYFV